MREDWDLETTVLLISLAIIPVLVAIIILCLKIKSSKSNPDLYGVEGTVKKTRNEEGFNGSATSGGASAANTSDNKLNVSGDDSRADVRTPSYDRKLPDIPNSDDIYKNSSTRDDNSELYATVDEVPANAGNLINSRPDIPPVPGPSASSFDSKNHPYAKVKKTRRQEHPYAKVGETKDEAEENTDTEEYDTTDNLRPHSSQRHSGRSQSGGPGGWRRPGDHHDGAIRNPSRQATPLPPEPPQYPDQGHPQQHFSGDSQDSFGTKGYTSISVREPLAMIRDIRHVPGAGGVIQEGNYVTLSETSDEMYAAIEDTVYMNPGGKESGDKEDEESDPNNMYSKVDKVKKKTNRETKSYDASNPYATVNKPSSSKQMSQSSDNLGARPKQRPPRVPAPGLDSVDYSEYEVSHTDRRTEQPLFNMARSYNDHEFRGRPDPNYETLPPYADSQLSERDPGYEMVQQRRGRRDPDYETVTSEVKDPGYEVVSGPRGRVNSLDPGYETVPQKRDPGYESVKPPASNLDPGYETVQTSRGQRSGPRSFPPEYESVSRDRDPGYESVGGFRDPGYETVPVKRAASLEPGYETLPERAPSSPAAPAPSSETVYSVVNKKQRAAPAATLPPGKLNREASDEEGYETIPGDKRKHSGLQEYDPGYEELPPLGAGVSRDRDPEYETITAKPVREADTGVERIKDADIEFIDESADELEDGLAELKSEDLTVDSSASSSLIHMSVVDSGPGVRRSSVVVIEHVPELQGEDLMEEEEEIQTHIFV